jgi:hypothetical protein
MSETTLPRRKAILDQLAAFRLPPRIVAPASPVKPGPAPREISPECLRPGGAAPGGIANDAARTGKGRPIPAKPVTEVVPARVAARPPAEKPRGMTSRARNRLRRRRAAREHLWEVLDLHKAETTALRVVLMERYPAAFSEPPRPLKIGIDRDIVADLVCDAEILALTMYQWTRHPHYLTALRGGGPRFGLDGSEQGEVSEEDRSTNTRHRALVPALRDCSRQIECGEAPAAGPR